MKPRYLKAKRSDRCCRVRCLSALAADPATRSILSAETADATASDSINTHNFAGISPIFRAPDESCAHGIFEDVIPFRGVALVTAQEVIIKSRLPKRREFLSRNLRDLLVLLLQDKIEMPLQAFYPGAQRHSASQAEAHKQMDVIRHDDIATNADLERFRACAVLDDGSVNFRIRKNPLPAMRVERDEVNRRIEPLKDQVQTRRLALDLPNHTSCCPQRTSRKAWPRRQRSVEDSGLYSICHFGRATGVLP